MSAVFIFIQHPRGCRCVSGKAIPLRVSNPLNDGVQFGQFFGSSATRLKGDYLTVFQNKTPEYLCVAMRPVFCFEPKLRRSDSLQGITATSVRSRGYSQKLSNLLINFIQLCRVAWVSCLNLSNDTFGSVFCLHLEAAGIVEGRGDKSNAINH